MLVGSESGNICDQEGLAGFFLCVSIVVLLNLAERLIESFFIDLGWTLFRTVDLGLDFAGELFHVVDSHIACTFSIDSSPAFLKGCLNLSLELFRADLFNFWKNKFAILCGVLVQGRWAKWERSHFVGEFGTVTDVDVCLIAILVESERAWPN